MNDRYVVESLVPRRQIHLLIGASGAGKTTLGFQLCRDLLDGKPWMGHKVVVPKSFAYVACDRPAEEYQEKFKILGITPFELHSLVERADFDIGHLCTHQGRKNVFPNIWAALGKPEFLVVDPISPFFPSNLKDYHQVADALTWFNRFCLHNDITIWGYHHAGKLRLDSQFARAQDRSNGSGAIQGYSGTNFVLSDASEVPGNPGYHLLTVVPHNAAPELHRFRRDALTGAFTVWTEAKEVARREQIIRIVPVPPEKIGFNDLVEAASDALDVSKRTIARDVKLLLEDGRISKTEDGYYSRRVAS